MLASNNKIIVKIIILFIVVISIFSSKVFSVVSPTEAFYVNDYANLIDSTTENYIKYTNQELYSQTGSQIVVVTVQSMEGATIEEYATELFRNFGIGDKTKNNGVLMLLALQERQFRIEVGYGLEGCLPDGKTGRIQDEYIIPYLSQGNWDAGIKNGFCAILEVVEKEYGVNTGRVSAQVLQKNSSLESVEDGIPRNIFLIIIISSVLGVVANLYKRSKKVNNKKLLVVSLVWIIISTILIVLKSSNIFFKICFSILNAAIFYTELLRRD